MNPKPNIRDVARHAGVSVGTVSNALNHPERLTAETLARVEATVKELGFVRNATAQQLRQGRAPTVGVGVLEISNPFFAEAASAMEDRIRAESCMMVLASTHADPIAETSLLRHFHQQNVRGILLTPCGDDTTMIDEIAGHGTPIVLFDTTSSSALVSSVGTDDVSGGRAAVCHLIALGHQRIGLISGPSSAHQARNRRAGAREAMAAAGLDPDDDLVEVSLARFDSGTGAAGMARLLTSAHPPTGVFCANNLIALGAVKVIRQRGLRLPGDVSIVGYDDIDVAADLMVPLTTVRQPMAKIGWTAADLLFREGGEVEHLRFEPDLIVRESTAPPRQR